MLLSQSFAMSGSGTSLEHNLRIVKTGGVRQIGVPERRDWNEHLLVDETLPKRDYVRQLMLKKVGEVVGDKLVAFNEKQIRNRHYNLVRDLQGFIDSQDRVVNGRRHSCRTEIVIQVGDKFSCCPYRVARNEQGRMLDNGGRVIPEWDTRRIPAYENGIPIESDESKLAKQIYRKYFKEFCKANPNFVPLSADIHADERGACHLHIVGFFVAKTKNGLGISLSRTSAIAQTLGNNGENTRKSNAQNVWRANMRQLLEDVCKEFGVERKDMHNTEPHRSIGAFCKHKDLYCEELEKEYNKLEIEKKSVSAQKKLVAKKRKKVEEKLQEVEEMSVSDIAKGMWYILKKNHPAEYDKIYNEFVTYRTKVRKNKKNENDIILEKKF